MRLRFVLLVTTLSASAIALACSSDSSPDLGGTPAGSSGSSGTPVADASATAPTDGGSPDGTTTIPEPPAGNQAWFKNAVIGEWAQIPNTQAPNELGDYSGIAVREAAGIIELLSLGAGGHGGNLTDNSVKGIRLDLDVPEWTVRRGPSDATGWSTTGSTGADFPSDNRPAPRHTYSSPVWIPELGRYLVGGRFWGSSAFDWWAIDTFNPATNDWDPPKTLEDPSHLGQLSVRDPATGLFYATAGSSLVVFTPSTKTFSQPKSFLGSATIARTGNAFDTKRGAIYHLSAGDNFSAGGAINSATIDPTSANTTAIGYEASPGWSSFQANASQFLTTALTYDADLDRFYFHNGGAEGAATVYRVEPVAGTTWKMDIVPVTGVTPEKSKDFGGVQNKFFYVRSLRACILVVPNHDIYFLRMS